MASATVIRIGALLAALAAGFDTGETSSALASAPPRSVSSPRWPSSGRRRSARRRRWCPDAGPHDRSEARQRGIEAAPHGGLPGPQPPRPLEGLLGAPAVAAGSEQEGVQQLDLEIRRPPARAFLGQRER